MSISYFGHCKLPVAEAQRRITFIRQAQPEWFDVWSRSTRRGSRIRR
jgi:hypothetical protein